MKRYRLAIDIGGTFTDLVLYDKLVRSYSTGKILTTPKNLAKGVMDGIQNFVSNLEEIEYFVHGTTSGLNAFLERKGAKVALIVTENFKDIYEIGRANRPDMYSITYRKPEPLVHRRDVFELSERMMADGSIEKELDTVRLEEVIQQIRQQGFNSVAVCLLHAYKNPLHEIMVLKALQRMAPEINVSLSHEIAREWREYERTSTAVINAYVAPIVRNYLTSLEEQTKEKGLENDLYIMQSNGGVMTSEIAKQIPIQTLMSGPVGGAIGGIYLGEQTSYPNLICVDMGGTSFDVSLIIDGKPDVTSETNLEGFPILSPMVNIHTIGAGGGSIGWIEAGGLRVGPKSAGSEPGPACYGNGGTEPTVTDANLVLGRMDESGFLGGKMKLDRDAAYRAVKSIADQLGLGVIETAEGICDIANAKMADAIRTLTVRKGIDPRDFVLVAFGGAGPMHAVLIAELLGIKRILVPKVAGTFSAWGMLQTDIRYDTVRHFAGTIKEIDVAAMEQLYLDMKNETVDILSKQKVTADQMEFYRSADIRYVGQEYTVNVPNQDEPLHAENISKLSALFHDMHLNIYGHHNPAGMIEIVNIRVAGYGKMERVIDKGQEETGINPPSERLIKPVIWNREEKSTLVYTTDTLQPGHVFSGPAVIEDPSSTTVVPAGFGVKMDRFGNLLITKEA
jgi:N-methylhydantoinase A